MTTISYSYFIRMLHMVNVVNQLSLGSTPTCSAARGNLYRRVAIGASGTALSKLAGQIVK